MLTAFAHPIVNARILPEADAEDSLDWILTNYAAVMRNARPEFTMPEWGVIVSSLVDVDDADLGEAVLRNLDLRLARELGLSQEASMDLVRRLTRLNGAVERLAVLDVVRQFWAGPEDSEPESIEIGSRLAQILAN